MATLALAGCSFLFTHGPPEPLPGHGPIRCTESLAAPTVDTLGAAGAALASVGALAANGPSFFLGPRVAAIDAVGFLAWGISAVVGYRRVYACDSAHDELRAHGEP
jgi:hypothetical protein